VNSPVPGRARAADVAFAAAACIVLAGFNNLAGAQPWHRRWYPAVNALAATATLAAAAASGLTATDLGLRRDRLRAGLRLGSAAAAPVVAAFGLAALTPATRPLLNDQRIVGLDRRELAYQVLLRIPVGTVAWEEIAFRGVLRAALRRVMDEPAATVVGSAMFGLWHIRPTAEALAVNRLAAGRGARIFAVTAVAAGTAGAGAVLSLLRERSGSLAAPILLHLAVNCAGLLASALTRSTGLDAIQDRLVASATACGDGAGTASMSGNRRFVDTNILRPGRDRHPSAHRDLVLGRDDRPQRR
jgi:membrane protease YdiL (CAAX protease family)